MSEAIAIKLEKIISLIIKGVIFLLPWFFLPWTSEYFEFNKQFLLWLFAPLAALLWLYKTAAEGQLKIKNNPLNFPILIFLLLTAAASIFGLDRFSSFFGNFGGFSNAWLGLLSLAIVYFLIINTEVAACAEKISGLLKLSVYSASVAAGLSLASMLGWLAALSGEPLGIFSSAGFNPAGGSLFNLAVFLAVMSVISANFLLAGGLKKFEYVFFSSCLILFLVILSLIDFPLSWALVFWGAALMIFFRWLREGPNFRKILNYYLLIPAALMLLSVLMLALPKINLSKIILGQNLPKDALLAYGQSWTITRETLKEKPLLGSGPGTFAEDFSLYRPAELNSSPFWQIRFQKSGSHLLEILATAGLLTGLSYFLIICLIIYLNIILIKKYSAGPPTEAGGAGGQTPLNGQDYSLITVLFTVFILIFFSQIFFLTNTVLNFIFWLAAGLIMAFWQRANLPLFKEKAINLRQTILSYRLFISGLFILTAATVVLLAFEVKFFAADLIAALEPRREANLRAAIKLNPYRPSYQISLAKFYLNQTKTEALKPLGQINSLKIQTNITEAIDLAKQSAAAAPNSVLPRETLGMIYRDIKELTLGSEAWAVKYFSEALALEPTNPVLAAELAKAYSNINDLAGAEKYFRRSLELKADYYEAKLGLAKTYLKGKQDNRALVLLNELARQIETAEIYYELGRFYYNHGEIDKAMNRFRLALNFSPQHANSLYSLAIAYEAKGDPKEALKYYQQVLKIDQANKEVEQKIRELSK